VIAAAGARCALAPVSLAALVALVALPGAYQDERADRLTTAELRVRGPADAIAVDVPGAGRALFEGRVPAGTDAVFAVPLPVPALAPGHSIGAARVTCEGGGSAAIGPRAEADQQRRARFEALPRGLRARSPIAPPEALPPVPSPGAVLLVAALFTASWVLRRRGLASLLLGSAGAALVLAIGTPWRAEEPAVFTVAEGQGPVPTFVLVESARGRLAIGSSADLLRLESRPSAAELVLRGSPSGRDLRIEAAGATASSATLFAMRDGSSLSATREQNGVFDLEQVWLRERGESEWIALGPWPRLTPLPGLPPPSPDAIGAAGPEAPPGWLIAGLPQGPAALVGGGGRRWMRWVDLPEPP
jgi:hypothetical protein